MSNILQKDIPRVKELCDLLGFRIGSDRPHFTLTDLTHTWRRQYVADDGTPGNELKEWRNPKTQDGLESMTMSYLGDQGYGEKLWPSKHSSHPDEFLEYRKNKAQIVQLMKQLFWRQNTNEARNFTWYQGRDLISQSGRTARSPSSVEPSPRLPPASQLTQFRATPSLTDDRDHRAPYFVPDRIANKSDRTTFPTTPHISKVQPSSESTLPNGPRGQEPPLVRPSAIKQHAAGTPAKRKEQQGPSSQILDNNDIYAISSSDVDADEPSKKRRKITPLTPMFPQPTTPPKTQHKTPPSSKTEKRKKLPRATTDHDSDDCAPRERKKPKVSPRKPNISPKSKNSAQKTATANKSPSRDVDIQKDIAHRAVVEQESSQHGQANSTSSQPTNAPSSTAKHSIDSPSRASNLLKKSREQASAIDAPPALPYVISPNATRRSPAEYSEKARYSESRDIPTIDDSGAKTSKQSNSAQYRRPKSPSAALMKPAENVTPAKQSRVAHNLTDSSCSLQTTSRPSGRIDHYEYAPLLHDDRMLECERRFEAMSDSVKTRLDISYERSKQFLIYLQQRPSASFEGLEREFRNWSSRAVDSMSAHTLESIESRRDDAAPMTDEDLEEYLEDCLRNGPGRENTTQISTSSRPLTVPGQLPWYSSLNTGDRTPAPKSAQAEDDESMATPTRSNTKQIGITDPMTQPEVNSVAMHSAPAGHSPPDELELREIQDMIAATAASLASHAESTVLARSSADIPLPALNQQRRSSSRLLNDEKASPAAQADYESVTQEASAPAAGGDHSGHAPLTQPPKVMGDSAEAETLNLTPTSLEPKTTGEERPTPSRESANDPNLPETGTMTSLSSQPNQNTGNQATTTNANNHESPAIRNPTTSPPSERQDTQIYLTPSTESQINTSTLTQAETLAFPPLPSQKSTAPPSSTTTTTTSTPPTIHLRFTLIKSRHPRLHKLRWSDGSLSAHTATSLFAEIARITSRPQISHIAFKLTTSSVENEIVLRAGDEDEYRAMREEFTRDIKSDVRATGNRNFWVEVEPDPEEGAGAGGVVGGIDDDLDICI